MSKFKGLKKNIVKSTIDNMEFVRVTNLNEQNELINVNIYTKINDKYKSVLPNQLPYQLVNKLHLENTYTKMTQEEIISFLNKLDNVKEEIKAQNQFNSFEYLEIDTAVDVNYIVTKTEGVNFYNLGAFKVNEFGIIEQETFVQPLELPYVMVNIIDSNKDFEHKTFLICTNHFAHVYRLGNKYLTLIFEFKPSVNKEEDKSSVQLRGMFTIVNMDDSYHVVMDEQNKLFVELNEEEFLPVFEVFLNNIGLERRE